MIYMNRKNIALILSGGEGKRFDKSKPKQFFKINDQTILEITVEKFIKSSLFNNVIVVCPLKHKSETQRLLKKFKSSSYKQIDSKQSYYSHHYEYSSEKALTLEIDIHKQKTINAKNKSLSNSDIYRASNSVGNYLFR